MKTFLVLENNMKAQNLSKEKLREIVSTDTYKTLRNNFNICINMDGYGSVSSPLSPIGFKKCEKGVEIFSVETENPISVVPDISTNKEIGFSIIDAMFFENLI